MSTYESSSDTSSFEDSDETVPRLLRIPLQIPVDRVPVTAAERRIIVKTLCQLTIPDGSHLICYGIFWAELFIFLAFANYVILMRNCNREPEIALKEFTIRDMTVFHMVTSTNSTPWRVSSDIDLTLSFKNRNKVAGCFTTLLHMEVSVYYAGNSTISVSNLPLQFSLKPRRSVGVSAQLQGERFLIMNNSAGSALAADVRRENITLQLGIATRYSNSNGLLQWSRTFCEVVAITPSETNSRPASLLRKKCVDMTYLPTA